MIELQRRYQQSLSSQQNSISRDEAYLNRFFEAAMILNRFNLEGQPRRITVIGLPELAVL